MKTRTILALTMVLLIVLSGVALAVDGIPSTLVSIGGITPYIIDGEAGNGHRTCEEVGIAYFGDANYYAESSYHYYDDGWDPPLPDGLDAWRSSPQPKQLEWESVFYLGAVIVWGGGDANTYVYDDPQALGDSGLSAPPNTPGGNNFPAVSWIGFCWNPGQMCYEEETAWADGEPYNPDEPGNWATYTPYYGEEQTVTLYAGQTMDAGTVHFSAPEDGDVTITITLGGSWYFADVDENVKIQDYIDAPSGNPQPGHFDWKYNAEESPFSASVPQNNFYGVHVDLLHEVECP